MVIVNRLLFSSPSCLGSFNLRSGNKLATDRPSSTTSSYSFFFFLVYLLFFTVLNLWIYFLDISSCHVQLFAIFRAFLAKFKYWTFPALYFWRRLPRRSFYDHQTNPNSCDNSKKKRYIVKDKRERHAMTMPSETCNLLDVTRGIDFPPPEQDKKIWKMNQTEKEKDDCILEFVIL
jgi:hypothetical protein